MRKFTDPQFTDEKNKALDLGALALFFLEISLYLGMRKWGKTRKLLFQFIF